MFKQIRQWQNAFTITLILMCVGVGLGHHIEAALDSDHSEQCTICILGSSPPVVSSDAFLVNHHPTRSIIETTLPSAPYQHMVWPGYSTRAPPLV